MFVKPSPPSGAPVAISAMQVAFAAHADQKRKYTGDPYTSHLAEVAGIVAAATGSDEAVSIAWLHDTIEDTATSFEDLHGIFGLRIAASVVTLSDLETVGNRAARKAAARVRLAAAPPMVQTIKVADIISNTSSIVLHDPKFARVYLPECVALLNVLAKADSRLLKMAWNQISKTSLEAA